MPRSRSCAAPSSSSPSPMTFPLDEPDARPVRTSQHRPGLPPEFPPHPPPTPPPPPPRQITPAPHLIVEAGTGPRGGLGRATRPLRLRTDEMLRELQPGDPQMMGPYRLRSRLGQGGMGQVFLGISAGGRLVAVKIVRADLATDPEFRARFRREVAVARTVSGQFTAPVIDADLDCPTPWLATAYVAGPSLAEAVVQHGPLPASSVLKLAAGLAEGLTAIHTAGVVHRDLKPANVLLADDGPR